MFESSLLLLADSAGHAADAAHAHAHGPTPFKVAVQATGILPTLLALIPAFPLLAAAILALLGKPILKGASHIPCVLGIFLSFCCSLAIFFLGDTGSQPVTTTLWTWIAAGDANIHVTLRADALTTTMLCMVTFVATLVAIYASGYMHGDPGYPRFFAAVSLFVFSMTMLVLSSNLVLLYVFWEAVGLCSYLLIGFWFRKPSAAAAAQKAFLVNRIGDFGFSLGIFLIWVLAGLVTNWTAPAGKNLLDYDAVLMLAGKMHEQYPGLLTLACLLLFTGAMGKSAQFPLHVWLPDAMEGPTPVSALIHAATMVTAGVYMVARLTPLYILCPDAQAVIAVTGGITALLAALIALTQYDLKRVMAYSTVSQLGFMFMALGAAAVGGKHPDLAGFAVMAAMFHLFTHAFFKALLFLGSGSVMHSMGHVIDMREFSGLKRVMPITHWTFLIGALALAGVPGLSGFFSKDEILVSLAEAGHHGPYAGVFSALYWLASAVSFLTAFYTFRAYFMTFHGPEKFPKEAGDHPHESPPAMALPLVILAVLAAGVGIVVGPFTHWFANYLYRTPGLTEAHVGIHWSVMGLSALISIAGVSLAWAIYCRAPATAAALRKGAGPLAAISENRFYLDELFSALIVFPTKVLAVIASVFDRYVVDGLVDFVGSLPRQVGGLFRPIQNGLVQNYAVMSLIAIGIYAMCLLGGLSPW
jgi:NADH-quinone oxidoreductase subunit L